MNCIILTRTAEERGPGWYRNAGGLMNLAQAMAVISQMGAAEKIRQLRQAKLSESGEDSQHSLEWPHDAFRDAFSCLARMESEGGKRKKEEGRTCTDRCL